MPTAPRDPGAHETADVVIIGGGVNGLATAIELKELGVDKVVLLERHLIGAGQSGRTVQTAIEVGAAAHLIDADAACELS